MPTIIVDFNDLVCERFLFGECADSNEAVSDRC